MFFTCFTAGGCDCDDEVLNRLLETGTTMLEDEKSVFEIQFAIVRLMYSELTSFSVDMICLAGMNVAIL
jgi:hypothetical protein